MILNILFWIVIESKPDFSHLDLRISDPFPALKAYADSFDLNSLKSNQHAHVPFPVILIKALDDWKKEVIIFVIV